MQISKRTREAWPELAVLDDKLDTKELNALTEPLATMLGERVARNSLDDAWVDANPKMAHIHGLGLFVYENLGELDALEAAAAILDRCGEHEMALDLRTRLKTAC